MGGVRGEGRGGAEVGGEGWCVGSSIHIATAESSPLN
jgi:hypothetical protein